MVEPVTGFPLSSSLLFCLFSFLFGVGLSVLRAVLRGGLSALSLLPPVVRRTDEEGARGKETVSLGEERPQDAANGSEKKGKKKRPWRYAFGYLLLDLSFFALAAILYLLFLFLLHGGVLRFYSLMLVLLGAFLSHSLCSLWIARPTAALLALPFRAVRALLSPLFARIFRFARRKKAKQLDETDKMV